MMGLYALLLGLVGAGLLGLGRALGRSRQLPFRPGVYLFPVGVITAHRSELDLYPWNDLRESKVSGDSRELRLVFGQGREFKFRLNGPEHATRVEAELDRVRERLEQAQASARPRDLAQLDPLTDNGIPNPLLPDTPLSRREAWWSKGWWWLGPALGIGLAWPLWAARNYWGQRALLATAHKANTPAAYRAYLTAVGPDDAVSRVLLPRAELAEAERAGSVEAVNRVLDRYPDARGRPEFAAALRRALLSEVERIRQAKSPDALRRFRALQPHQALVAAEIDAALHATYAAGLAQYRADASPRRPDPMSWVSRLFDYAERHGPRVEIRFARKLDPSVTAADERVMKSPYAGGPAGLPSQYFDGAHAGERERRTGEVLRARFARTIPSALIDFELGGLLLEDPKDGAFGVPTLVVEHTTLMNGTHANPKPPHVLVGVGILFQASLHIPGDSSPGRFKFSFWHAPDRTELRELDAERFYPQVAEDAFAQFSAKYLGSVFKTP
jgi:hypothetical protein